MILELRKKYKLPFHVLYVSLRILSATGWRLFSTFYVKRQIRRQTETHNIFFDQRRQVPCLEQYDIYPQNSRLFVKLVLW